MMITPNLPVTFAASLSDEELKLLAIARILGEGHFPELEAIFGRVVTQVRMTLPAMSTNAARGIARMAIDVEAAIRWVRLTDEIAGLTAKGE